jgi:DNA-binding NarL/FixJ family response regulator
LQRGARDPGWLATRVVLAALVVLIAFAADWAVGRAGFQRVIVTALGDFRATETPNSFGHGDEQDLSAARLSPRQQEVLRQIVAGRSDRQIADALFISHRTASYHVSAIMSKLSAHTRGDAAVRAVRDGLI